MTERNDFAGLDDLELAELDGPRPSQDRLERDDALLDAIGRNELPAELDEDPLLLAMARWRDDLDFNQPTGPLPGIEPLVATAHLRDGLDRPPIPLAAPQLAAEPAGDHPDRLTGPLAGVEPQLRPAADPLAPRLVKPARSRQQNARRRGSRLAIVLTSVAVLLGGGVTVAAAGAQPGSPLWPLSEVVYADRAAAIHAAADARQALDTAQVALDEQRPADAARALLAAEDLIGKVNADDRPALVQRFEQIRTSLISSVAELITPTPTPEPTTAPNSGSPKPTESAGPGNTPSGTPQSPAGTPSPTPSDDGGLLDLLPRLLDPLVP